MREVNNETSSSVPIFFHSKLIETSPIGAGKFFSANRRDFNQIRMEKNRRRSAYIVYNFAHVCLSNLGPIRVALTSQVLSTDTKFSLSQSRVTLPLKQTL